MGLLSARLGLMRYLISHPIDRFFVIVAEGVHLFAALHAHLNGRIDWLLLLVS